VRETSWAATRVLRPELGREIPEPRDKMGTVPITRELNAQIGNRVGRASRY